MTLARTKTRARLNRASAVTLSSSRMGPWQTFDVPGNADRIFPSGTNIARSHFTSQRPALQGQIFSNSLSQIRFFHAFGNARCLRLLALHRFDPQTSHKTRDVEGAILSNFLKKRAERVIRPAWFQFFPVLGSASYRSRYAPQTSNRSQSQVNSMPSGELPSEPFRAKSHSSVPILLRKNPPQN